MRSIEARFAVLLCFSVMLLPGVAEAHAAYESSDPASGSTVSSPPSRVTTDFTEPVVDQSRIEVYDPCGQRVDNSDWIVAADRITVTMSADKQGTYKVHFAVVSSIDGHATEGDFNFDSSGGSACAAETDVSEEEQPSDGGGGSATSGDPAPSSSDEPADDEVRPEATGDSSVDISGRREKPNPPGQRDRPEEASVRGDEVAVELAPSSEVAAERFDNGVPEDIPLSALALAFGISALVGLAGGYIYRGLMGATDY